jgi:hypothetical protein
MYNFPETTKALKSRIASYRSSLLKEKKRFGHVNDGDGMRYLLFSLYFVLNDTKETKDYIEWYEEEFSDDMGEPIQKLCWALSLRRMNDEKEAKKLLAETMLTNLYILPKVLDRKIERYDIWHPSSDQSPGYVGYLPKEVISAITEEEKRWISQQYDSSGFGRIRQRYIEIYHDLKDTSDLSERGRLLDESYSLVDSIQ